MFALKPAHILLGTIAISGCTSSYTVDCEGIPKKNHLTCSEVQRRIGESNATIVFEDGRRLEADSVTITPDTTWIHRSECCRDTAIATKSVRAIEVIHRANGGVLGFFAGAMVGGFAGSRFSPSGNGDMMGLGRALNTMGGIVAGGLAGMTIGILRGNTDEFRFTRGAIDEATSSPPRGREGSGPADR